MPATNATPLYRPLTAAEVQAQVTGAAPRAFDKEYWLLPPHLQDIVAICHLTRLYGPNVQPLTLELARQLGEQPVLRVLFPLDWMNSPNDPNSPIRHGYSKACLTALIRRLQILSIRTPHLRSGCKSGEVEATLACVAWPTPLAEPGVPEEFLNNPMGYTSEELRRIALEPFTVDHHGMIRDQYNDGVFVFVEKTA